MGGAISRQEKAQRVEANTFQILIKLDSKETIERLERVRSKAYGQNTCLCCLLRMADSGLDLERQLIRIENEIHVTVRLLLRKKVPARAYLAEEVLALEKLLPQFQQHLEQLRTAYMARSRPPSHCEMESKRLATCVLRRAEGLRRMRCQLIGDVFPEMRSGSMVVALGASHSGPVCRWDTLRSRWNRASWDWVKMFGGSTRESTGQRGQLGREVKQAVGILKAQLEVDAVGERVRPGGTRLIFFPPFRPNP